MYIPGSPFNVYKFFQLLPVCTSLSEPGSPSTAVVNVRGASCPFSCGLAVCAGPIYVCQVCFCFLSRNWGVIYLRVTLCLVMCFHSRYFLCEVFGGQAVAESPTLGAHGFLFLTVSKISIGHGMYGVGGEGDGRSSRRTGGYAAPGAS